jgi:hypothetical protein
MVSSLKGLLPSLNLKTDCMGVVAARDVLCVILVHASPCAKGPIMEQQQIHADIQE